MPKASQKRWMLRKHHTGAPGGSSSINVAQGERMELLKETGDIWRSRRWWNCKNEDHGRNVRGYERQRPGGLLRISTMSWIWAYKVLKEL